MALGSVAVSLLSFERTPPAMRLRINHDPISAVDPTCPVVLMNPVSWHSYRDCTMNPVYWHSYRDCTGTVVAAYTYGSIVAFAWAQEAFGTIQKNANRTARAHCDLLRVATRQQHQRIHRSDIPPTNVRLAVSMVAYPKDRKPQPQCQNRRYKGAIDTFGPSEVGG
ncbi:hypothetical protein C8Q80DRAFT_1123095 [Daedaleopsis nitida]|nr:hypothetical protein C8Q80DRAFT_1123095 [Daedaleopsis nitida]